MPLTSCMKLSTLRATRHQAAQSERWLAPGTRRLPAIGDSRGARSGKRYGRRAALVRAGRGQVELCAREVREPCMSAQHSRPRLLTETVYLSADTAVGGAA
jgi:hypothetical protein